MPGDSVSLHVSTAQGASYRVLVYRLGWYGGLGARQVACLPSCGGAEVGVQQPMNIDGDMHAAGRLQTRSRSIRAGSAATT